MEIAEINKEELFQITKESLFINEHASGFIDDAVLAGSLRRVAGFLCPCSKGVLMKELIDSLAFLVDDGEQLKNKIEELVLKLIVIGDLLELTDVSTTDLTVKSTWLFAAPPSFVVRRSEITIIGITPDEVNPISSISPLHHSGFRRFIPVEGNENISPTILIQLGLIQISEANWLRLPKLKNEMQMLWMHFFRVPILLAI